MNAKYWANMVCRCPAYPFPHRPMSGKCTDDTILAAVWERGDKCNECSKYYRGSTPAGGPDPAECTAHLAEQCECPHPILQQRWRP